MAKICAICHAEEVTSTNPDTDFCRTCHYLGRAEERRFAALLDRIRDLDGVSANVGVWHTGGGCFNLAVTLLDGRLLTPSIGYRDEKDGRIWAEAGLPFEPEDRWAMVVSEDEQAWTEWDESRLHIPQALYTEDELVEAIRRYASTVEAAR